MKQWKPIIEVSNDGQVRMIGGRILSTRTATRGYQGIGTIAVHRLVALAFLGPPPKPNSVVNHIDGNTMNNEVSNLEWMSQQENCRHHGKKNRRLSDAVLRAIKQLKPANTITLKDLAATYGVTGTAARACRSGRTWNGKKRSNRAKLTPEAVVALRAWKPPSPTASEVGRRFKVTPTTVLSIWNN